LLREGPVMSVEMRFREMSPQERVNMVNELLERGGQYLPACEAALARGEMIIIRASDQPRVAELLGSSNAGGGFDVGFDDAASPPRPCSGQIRRLSLAVANRWSAPNSRVAMTTTAAASRVTMRLIWRSRSVFTAPDRREPPQCRL
jgi:hypothetical protein